MVRMPKSSSAHRRRYEPLAARVLPPLVAAVLFATAVLAAPAGSSGVTRRVSVDDTGTQGNSFSFQPAMSGNGQIVAFVSNASNLVIGDTNGLPDVFVHDLGNGLTERVSVDNDGMQAGEASFDPDISDSGRFVVFQTFGALVADDTNNTGDIYVRDRQTNTVRRVSVDAAGTQANGNSSQAAISADGRTVAFVSFASNLVPGDTNAVNDVFVKDLETGTISMASISSSSVQANNQSDGVAISADGRVVAFRSFATNLVPDDTNSTTDVFVHEVDTALTERVSVNSDEQEANLTSQNSALSADGRLVAFDSAGTNLAPGDTNGVGDIFLRDRFEGTTTRVSVTLSGEQATGGGSLVPDITPDGRFVGFRSSATNLVPDDTNSTGDIFVKDLSTGAVDRVSVASDGTQADARSLAFSLDSVGRVVAFESDATNLVGGDTNNQRDVFVHDRGFADVALTKTDDVDPAPVGRPLTYRLEVENSGPSVAWDTRVMDFLPEQVRFVSATPTAGQCVHDTGTVTCDLGNLSAGSGGASVTIVVRPVRMGTLTNTAEVASAIADPDTTNNRDVEVTEVTAGP
jgi:uncharacterized repeat protein (TIGR01451 family)